MSGTSSAAADRIRIDKWLWFARFFKTRGLAAQEVGAGHVRVNGDRVSKPAQPVRPGDTLTFAQGRQIRVVRIVALGERRGPAPEAQMLYEDLSPTPAAQDIVPPAPGYDGKGRPSAKDRRNALLSRRDLLE